MLLLPRTLQAIAVLYRLPARAVRTMDPGISPGKIEGAACRMVLAQPLSSIHPTRLALSAIGLVTTRLGRGRQTGLLGCGLPATVRGESGNRPGFAPPRRRRDRSGRAGPPLRCCR